MKIYNYPIIIKKPKIKTDTELEDPILVRNTKNESWETKFYATSDNTTTD